MDDNIDENGVVEALMQVNSLLEPVIDFASGLRTKLVSMGWSEEIAGDISGEVLKRMITMGMGGVR